MNPGVVVRDAVSGDLPALHAINQASRPGVGSVTAAELGRLVEMAVLTRVAERRGEAIGFILCLLEGADYASPNYRWISARFATFAYCDRIAIAQAARGQGIGEQLYGDVMHKLAGVRPVLTCEVNLEPPNPGSMRFHERLGFRRLGESWNAERSYGVAYLGRDL